MTTHAQLTEPSLSPHARKGREGKGTGKGREDRWETEHHCVAYVTCEAASPKPVQPSDGMMPLRARSIG